jgi:hypothetical protein
VTHVLGGWGLLPIAGALFVFLAGRLGALAWRGAASTVGDRAVAGVLLAFASVLAIVSVLSLFHAISPLSLLAALAVAAALLFRVAPPFTVAAPLPSLDRGSTLALAALAAVSLAWVTLAARWLPVWQWDALGYHLPFVHFTLAAASMDGVPRELEYIGSYPHDVEVFFVALRALLPDDRLIDFGQIPFGVAGAIVTAALARREGASREASLLAGAAWIVVPAVFLQLPTNYVDVGAAFFLLCALYFTLSPPRARTVALAGLALGLFIGSKPSAPLAVCVVFVVLSLRAVRGGEARALLLAVALTLAFGGGSYAENLTIHHNPLWPMRIDLGPLHLAGTHPLTELLSSGANAPRTHGPLPFRFLRSLFTLTSPPVFDMRIGGFGPVVLCALPLSLYFLWRKRDAASWALLFATLTTPDPAIARYVLAFPAFILATAAPVLSRAPARVAAWGVYAAIALGGLCVVYAAPGLSGEGPPLPAYATMSEHDRALAVGADGPPLAVVAARGRVLAGEAFAFDENMDLSDLVWDARPGYRVVYLSSSLRATEMGQTLDKERVRAMAVGEDAVAGVWAKAHPEVFERMAPLSSCRRGSCAVFVRR